MASVISFLFCTFLVFSIATGYCPKQQIESIPALVTLHDTFLEGYTITTLLVDSILQCFFQCISPKYCDCLSVNFQYMPNAQGFHLCDLKNESKGTVGEHNLVSRTGFDHINAVSHFSSMVSISDGKDNDLPVTYTYATSLAPRAYCENKQYIIMNDHHHRSRRSQLHH